MGQLELASPVAIDVVGSLFDELQVRKIVRADERDDVLVVLVGVVVLKLGIRALEVRMCRKGNLLRFGAVGHAGQVNYKIALVEVLAKQLGNIARARAETL